MKIYPFLLLIGIIVSCSKRDKTASSTEAAAKKTQVRMDSLRSVADSSEKLPPAFSGSNFYGSLYKGNFVWGGAAQLAWNELCEKFFHGDLQLKTNDKEALRVADIFNHSAFSKKDLDSASYFVYAGYGQESVNQINEAMNKRFPQQTFGNLQMQLLQKEIVAFAYFNKQLEYKQNFSKEEMNFLGEKVKGFYAPKHMASKPIILQYWNDDKFILKMMLKSDQDEVLLCKGFDMKNPDAMVEMVNQLNFSSRQYMQEYDFFEAPILKLDFSGAIGKVLGIPLANPGFENHFLFTFREDIKFKMDEKSTGVENRGVLGGKLGLKMDAPVYIPKQLLLNKPYWVIMKRKDSKNPYFILGVNNSAFMETEISSAK